VLVATALRVVVLPRFARAHIAGTLGREVGSWCLALSIPLLPIVVLTVAAPHLIARALTGSAPAQHAAAVLLPWLIVGAVAQVYTAIAVSALAAYDDYGTAAGGYMAGSVAGLATIVLLDDHGVIAFGWGPAVNGVVSLTVPLAALLVRRGLARPGRDVLGRLRALVEGAALPFALQGLYLIGYRFTTGLATGSPTTFSYAYLISSLLVAVTATSIALVSSVPLARGELTAERSAQHVVSASWLSLSIIAGAAGVFSLAGARVARVALGSHYGGGTGSELGRLVAYLAPWMVASVALSVAFPLLFVRGSARRLPLLAIAALAVQVPIEWAGRSLLGLAGIAAGLALTTGAVLIVLLRALHAFRAASAGLLAAAAICGGVAACCFAAPRLVLGPVPAAALGLVLYAGVLAAWRPAGLRAAWTYARGLV